MHFVSLTLHYLVIPSLISFPIFIPIVHLKDEHLIVSLRLKISLQKMNVNLLPQD